MPIFTYFGAPGSGKTYELVNRVMVEAVKQKRQVFHNIPGIDPEKWADEFGCDPASLHLVSDDWFGNDQNFPASDEEMLDKSREWACPGGSIIIVDEASTIFPPGTGKNSKVSPRLESWWRKHRHYTGRNGDDPTPVATDIYFATQDPLSLAKVILHLCMRRVDFEELKGVFGARSYRAIIYKSHRATKANRDKKPLLRKMDTVGWKRYHSFAGGEDAQLAKTENSFKVWTPGKIALFVSIPVLLLGGIGGMVWTGKWISDLATKPGAAQGNTALAALDRPKPKPTPIAASAGAFDPAYAIKGECVQSLLDTQARTYFDGNAWLPVRVDGGRWWLGACSVPAPAGV